MLACGNCAGLGLLLWACPAHAQQPARAARSAPGSTAATASTTALYKQGYAAFQAGDLQKAHVAFAQLVHLAPAVSAAHTALGEVLLAMGHASEAVPELKRAQALDPRDALAAAALGRAEDQLGDFAAAATAFSAADLDGTTGLSSEDALADAHALSNLGRREDALAVLQRAVRSTPGDARLHDAAGSLMAQQDSLDAAEAEFAEAITLDPTLASAHYHLGVVHLERNHAETAAGPLREACRLAPENAEYALQLGRALTRTEGGKAADMEAVAVLEKAHALASVGSPFHIDATYAYALALQNQGAPGQALPLFAEAALARPNDVSLLTNYGLALVQTGDAKHAEAVYQQALQSGSPTATLREDYGVAYLQSGDIEHAIEQFRQGLQLEPANAHLHYDLALAFKLKDDLAHAIPEFKETERIDPSLPDPAYTLGVVYMQQGALPDAARELERATTLRPDYGAAWASLGTVYHQQGDQARAAEALRRAITLEPEQPGSHVTLGAVLAETGDTAGALAERKIAAHLSRDAVDAQRAEFSLRSGRALLAEGKTRDAEAQLEAAISAAPALAEPHTLLAEAFDREGRNADASVERQKAKALATASAH